MGYDDGIVIDVGHPCIRPDFLGDLVTWVPQLM